MIYGLYDKAGDIWQLGIVMFYLVTGGYPYNAKTEI